jgi:uncharacterized membrane protein YdjX (TVP38/TMEM64 family)
MSDRKRNIARQHSLAPTSRQEWIGVGALAALVTLAVVGWFTGALGDVTEVILARRHIAEGLAETWPAVTLVVYIVAFALLTGGCLPVAMALTLVSGVVFGPFLGGGATVLGATGGATLTYLAARSALGPVFARLVAGTPRADRMIERMRTDPFTVILSARLMPMFPFAALNVAAGLARIPLRPYVLATLLAAIPTSFLYASIGAGLDEALGRDGASPQSIATTAAVGWPLLGLAVLAVVPLLVSATVRRFRST